MNKKEGLSLGSDVVNLTISKLITTVVSFITIMLLSRILTLEEYGTYTQLLLITNIFASIFMLGLPYSLNYFLARADSVQERQMFISVYYTLSTILSTAVGVILYFTAPIIVNFFENGILKQFTYFLIIFPWVKIIISSIENVLIIYRKTTLLIFYRLLNSCALLGIIIISMYWNYTFETYIQLFTIAESVFALSVYIIVAKVSKGLKVSLNTIQIKNIIIFSLPIGMSSIVGIINIELDKLMIGRFLDTESLAIYTNASRELPITIIAVSITAVLLPKLAELFKKNEDIRGVNIWGTSILMSYIFIAYIVSGIFTFAPEVITLLYSDKYLEGVPVFRIYALVLLLKVTYFGMILNAKGRTKFILYSSFFSLLLNLVLNFLLFNIIGFNGPAYATLLSQLVINLLQLFYTSKVIAIDFKKVFPWRKVAVISGINLLYSIVFYVLKLLLPINNYIGEVAESILLAIIWGAFYFILYFKYIKKLWIAFNKGE